jgi:eukaryotic-like serine/threonine-protein kinase
MDTLTPDLRMLFAGALERPDGPERDAYLDAACRGDTDLRARVEALLRSHVEAGDFLAAPPTADTPGPDPDRPRETGEAADVPLHRLPAEGVGAWIGPYKLLQEIGEGGMGVVFMAEQERPVRRRVALKVIKPGMDTGQVVARFEAERQALALMDHPNIARVLDAGTTDSGRPFFVMELVKGIPITEYCDAALLSPRERLELFIPACQAIQHAHQKGVIHRDIKPANILVTLVDGAPVPKVIDFGVAKAIEQRLTDRTLFTQFGAIVGTPEYMSPEQAGISAADVDTRSDIYSLGVLLYELLTGSTPLERESLQQAAFVEIIRRIREEEPPKPSTRLSGSGNRLASLSAVRQTEPARLKRLLRGDLDWIVMKALEKDRGRRYETANGFARDVRRYLDGDPVEAGPPSARYRVGKFTRKHRAALATAAAFALLLVAATAVSAALAVRASLARDDTAKALNDSETARKDADQKRAEVGRLSAGLALDRGLELAKSGRADRGLHCMAEALRIDGADVGTQSAARANIAAWTRQVPRPIAAASRPSEQLIAAALSPDGRIFAVGGLFGFVTLWNLDTMRPIGEPGSHEGKRVTDLAFRPDGGMLASAGADGLVRLWNPADGRPIGEPLRPPGAARAHGVAFHPDGKILFTACNGNFWLWDLATRQTIAGPINCVEPISGWAFSPDGNLLVTTTWVRQVQRRDGKTGQPIGPVLPTGEGEIAFSPDGRRFAVAYGGGAAPRIGRDGTGGVQIFGTDGTIVPRRHSHRVGVSRLRYSPDGKRLLTGDYDGMVRLYDDDGEPVAAPIKGEGAIVDLDFSHDGRLALIGTASGTAWLMDASDGRQLGSRIELAGELWVAFRPDGRTIVVAGDRAIQTFDVAEVVGPAFALHDNVRAVVFGPQGTRITASGGAGDKSAQIWSPDGRAVGPRLGHADDLDVVAVRGDGQMIVTGARDFAVRLWTPDGRPIGPPLSQTHWPSSLAFNREGDRLLVGCVDNQSQLFDPATGKTIGPPLVHPGNVSSVGISLVAFLPEAKIAVSISNEGSVGRMRTDTGEQIGAIHYYVPLASELRSVASLSPDGRFLMVIAGGSVHVSDAATGRELLPPFGRGIRTGAFLPDSNSVLIGGDDKAAQVWDVATGRPIGAPMEHSQSIRRVVVSPDGRTFLTLTEDEEVQLWDAAGRKPVGPPRRHDVTAAPPVFSPDGRWLALSAGQAEFWPIPAPEPGDPDQVRSRLRLLTGLELDERGGFSPIDVPALTPDRKTP